MKPLRLNLKLFTTTATTLAPRELVPIFHGWIQRRELPGELLIDVADYTHVADGPGVMLIGHEGHYAYEQLQGRTGFTYNLRRPAIEPGFEAALRYAMRQLLAAVSLLEAEPSVKGRLAFDRQRLQVQVNDRLHAPNDAQTWNALAPQAQPALARLLDPSVQIEAAPPGPSLFTLQVTSARPFDTRELMARAADNA